MEISFSNIPQIIKNSKVKQISSLYSSVILSIFAGIGVSYTLTHLLSPETFGDLKFVQNICSFVVVFFTLGYFYTGSLVIAKSETKNQKHQYLGALTFIGGIIALLYIFFIFFGSWLENIIFNNELGYIFRWFAPLLFIYPFELFCQNILVGDNKIHLLSVFRLGPKILYLLLCVSWNKFVYPLSLNSAFGLYLFSSAVFIIFSIFKLKPVFKDIKHNLKFINTSNRNYGFPLFLGALISFASVQLGGISIGYFIDNTNVGYFSLAVSSTLALAFIPGTIGTTFFKEFTKMKKIPSKVIKITIGISILALVAFLLIIKPLIAFLYTSEYLAVVPLAYFTAIAATLQGFGDLFNRYVSAHGLGNQLRNSSFLIGILNIIGYTIIVYIFGVNGAVITRLLAGLVYLLLMLRIYYKFIRNEQT